MTFDENGADREPPDLGGFFILCDLCIERCCQNAETAEGRRDRREALLKTWIR
jgi:hypothetical protein